MEAYNLPKFENKRSERDLPIDGATDEQDGNCEHHTLSYAVELSP